MSDRIYCVPSRGLSSINHDRLVINNEIGHIGHLPTEA